MDPAPFLALINSERRDLIEQQAQLQQQLLRVNTRLVQLDGAEMQVHQMTATVTVEPAPEA